MRRIFITAIVALLCIAPHPVVVAQGEHAEAAETTELENPSEVTARWMSEDLGITFDEALANLTRRDSVGRLYAALKDEGPATFDDLYIEYSPTYRVVVLANEGGFADVRAFIDNAGVTDIEPFLAIEETTYTSDELAASRATLEEDSGLDFESWIEIETGTIHANMRSTEDTQAILSILESGDVEGVPSDHFVIRTFTGGGFDQESNSFGGLDLNKQSDGSGECTSGFTVEQTDGGTALGVATAAHCANNLEFNSGDDLDFQHGKDADSQDTQWHLTPGYADQPWVRNGGTSHRTITERTARSAQIEGDYVCISKRNDSVRCGTVDSKIFDPGAGYNATFIRVEGGSTDLTVGGDSGGPWWMYYVGTPGCTCAYGTHVGAPTDDTNDAIYMAVNYMSDIDVRVLVG